MLIQSEKNEVAIQKYIKEQFINCKIESHNCFGYGFFESKKQKTANFLRNLAIFEKKIEVDS